jgi:RNA polymerase sigma-70 factor, ECF subfamily
MNESSSQPDGPESAPPAGGPGDVPPEKLFPALYGELRRIAAGLLAREGAGHTLDPTALVHEAYMKLAGQRTHGWPDRTAFVGIAAQAMRRILVDHARTTGAQKRGGSGRRIELTDAIAAFEERAIDLLGLDAALTELAALDDRKAKLVEIRFFGGLSVEEAATALGMTLRTAERDWAFARAWLRNRLTNAGPP